MEAGEAKDCRYSRIEFVNAGFEVEHRFGAEARMRRLKSGRDHFGRRLDQAAARLTGHLLERVEQMAQLAELQRPDLETPAADRDGLAHRPTH
jgi:hypothetical protein